MKLAEQFMTRIEESDDGLDCKLAQRIRSDAVRYEFDPSSTTYFFSDGSSLEIDNRNSNMEVA